MTRTQIYLPDNQLQYLRKRAYEENVSVSEIIRRIIADYMVKHKIK